MVAAVHADASRTQPLNGPGASGSSGNVESQIQGFLDRLPGGLSADAKDALGAKLLDAVGGAQGPEAMKKLEQLERGLSKLSTEDLEELASSQGKLEDELGKKLLEKALGGGPQPPPPGGGAPAGGQQGQDQGAQPAGGAGGAKNGGAPAGGPGASGGAGASQGAAGASGGAGDLLDALAVIDPEAAAALKDKLKGLSPEAQQKILKKVGEEVKNAKDPAKKLQEISKMSPEQLQTSASASGSMTAAAQPLPPPSAVQ